MSSADTSKVTEHWEFQTQHIRIGDIATRDVARIGRSRTLGEAAALMAERRISSVIVTDPEGRPWGVLTERDLLRAMDEERPGATQLADFMSAPVITVPLSMPMEAAYQLALREGVRHLVLVDEQDQLAGVVSETDFRLHLQLSRQAGRRSVLSVMGHTVLTLPPEASLRQAVHLMDCRRASCVVVVEAECPVGIITERDIARVYAAGNDTRDGSIAEFMTRPVKTIPMGTTINEAAEYMLATRIRHLIVADAAGRLVGLLDQHDLLRSLNETLLDARLESERAYLRGLFDAIPDPVWLKSPEGVYLACNDQLDTLLDLPKAQILGKVDTDLVSADAAQILRASDLAVMEKEAACITEESLNLVNRQGVFEVIKKPLRDSDGKLIGVLGIARDITERKRLEQEAREAEAKFRHLVEQSLVGIYIIRDGSFLYVNPGFADMFGFGSAEEIIGRVPFAAVVAPEDRPLVESAFETRMAGTMGDMHYGFRGLRADGRRIDIEAHGRTLTYNGQPACIGICLDVTVRKQAESREKARADFLDAMVRGEPLPALLERLVNALEAQIAGTLCSILLYDPVAQTLHLGAAPHLPDFYNEAVEGLKVGCGVGSCGTVVWEGRRVVCEDLRTHPYWQPFQAIAARAGLESCWSEPVLDAGGKVLGTFAVYGATPRTPTGEELESLGWATQLACLAIERRAMERRLAESEAHFRTLADSGQALIWTSDLDQRCTYFNQPWLNFTGESLERALGEGYLEAVIHPEDRERLQHARTDAFERREPFSLDYRLRRHDGEYRWMQAEGAPRHDSRGEFAGFIGHCIDITERQQARQELEASRARLQRILEFAPLPLCYVDGSGRLVFRNQRFLELMGYTEAEAPTLAEWWPLAYPDADYRQWALDTWDKAVERAVVNGSDITPVTYRVTCKNGEVRIFEISGITLGEDFLATFIDLTERVGAETALREKEAYLRAIVDNEPQCIKLLDRNGILLDMNPAGLAMIEADSLEQVRGHQVCHLVSPEDRPRFAAMIEAVFRGERQSLIFTMTGLKGMRRHLETHSVPLWDNERKSVRALLGVTLDITERRQGEERLRESEARFRALFEFSNDAIVIMHEGRCIDCNDRALEVYRCVRADIIGASPVQFAPPRQPDGVDSLTRVSGLAAAALAGQPQRFEWRHTRRDGTEFDAEVSLNAFGFGGKTLLQSVVRDITERKRAEMQLRKLAQVVEQSPETILITDKEGAIEYINPAFTLTTGYTATEAIGQNPRFLGARKTPPEVFADLWHTLSLGESWKGEFWNRAKDGREYLESAHITPIRQADGRISHYAGIQEDITEKKELEQKLNLYRDRLEELVAERTRDLENAHQQLGETFDAMSHAGIAVYWVAFDDGRLLEVNDRACQMLGYSREELLALTVPQLDPNYPLEGYAAVMSRVAQDRRLCIQTENRHKDGRLIPVEVTIYLPESEAVKPGRIVAFVTDISPRKAAEQALIDGRRAAEAASRAKSEFLANMSHEIRTPMNAILGLSHLLGQSDLAPAHHELVGKIHSAGDSLLGIINEILDFSKIEAGRMQIEQAPFRLSRLLDKLATLGSAAIGQKDIEYLIGPAPNGAEYLQGDALRLEQVLVNLISNAAKFTQTGEIRLDIAIVKAWNHHLELRFEVRDTGIGIPPEQREHIFTPFSQADSSTTRRYGGTGLGLSICQRLVALMGGTIGLDSVPGVGSTFWFTVALERVEPEEMPQLGLSTQRVLVVDDHPLARETLARVVRSLGWEVETEASGEAAVARFTRCPPDERPFDIILMDWKMPGMNGLSACQAIRDLQGLRAAPLLVMVTAYERERILAEPGSRHVDAILGKPLLASALFDAVAQVKLACSLAAKAAPKARSPGRLAGWRILVTDDNEINRDVARLNLESEGATVHLAENGQQALDWLEARSCAVDVVLMDVQMPVMDGYEATRRIREKPACQHLPIVALSAGVFQEHQAAALAAGMDAFIGKPFNPDEMVELLSWLVETPRSPGVPFKTPTLSADVAETLPLDVDKALRVWKSPTKYRDKLRVFVETHGGDDAAIARLAGLGEWADAAALAHRLKGVAGNLALLEVQRQAQQVESELRAGAVTETSLRGLDQVMTMALTAIAAYAGPSSESVGSSPERTGAQTAHLFRQLLSALALYSPEAAEPHLAALASRVTAEQLQPLRQAVEEFAFPEAEALTLRLAGTLGIQPDEIS